MRGGFISKTYTYCPSLMTENNGNLSKSQDLEIVSPTCVRVPHGSFSNRCTNCPNLIIIIYSRRCRNFSESREPVIMTSPASGTKGFMDSSLWGVSLVQIWWLQLIHIWRFEDFPKSRYLVSSNLKENRVRSGQEKLSCLQYQKLSSLSMHRIVFRFLCKALDCTAI